VKLKNLIVFFVLAPFAALAQLNNYTSNNIATLPGGAVLEWQDTNNQIHYAPQIQFDNGINGSFALSAISSVNSVLAYTNNLTYNVADYGAKCDMKYSLLCGMNTGGVDLTNVNGAWTIADLNKWIAVRYVNSNHLDLVAQITNVISTNHIQISLAAVNGSSNLTCRYGSDDTIPFQNLVNFACSNRGGTIFIPRPMVIAGPLQDVGIWTNHHNAQIIFPPMPAGGTHVPQINIIGPQNQNADDPVSATDPENGGGGEIDSFLCWADNTNHGALFDARNFNAPVQSAAVLGGYFCPLNALWLHWDGVDVVGCFDANMQLLNAQGFEGAWIEHTTVECQNNINANLYWPKNTNGLAIFMPGVFNNNVAILRNSRIGSGFYTGLAVADNFRAENINIFWCVQGLWWPNGEAGYGQITRSTFQNCSNILCNPGNFTVHLDGDYAIYQSGYPFGTNWNPVIDTNNQIYSGCTWTAVPTSGPELVPPPMQSYNPSFSGNPGTYISKTGPGRLVQMSRQIIQSGSGVVVGDNNTLDLGANQASTAISSSVQKRFSIGALPYETNVYTAVISGVGFNGELRLYIGGDDQQNYAGGGTHGANDIEFCASTNGATASNPVLIGKMDGLGFYPYFGTPNEGIGTPTYVWWNGYFGNENVTNQLFAGKINVTNFIAMPTNYVAANFAPPAAGTFNFVPSNNWVFVVSNTRTNPLVQINP